MKEWLTRLTLIAFGLFIVIVSIMALEFGLNIFAPDYRVGRGDILYEPDEHLGWKGIPNKEGKYRQGKITSIVKRNSHGFRDRERNYEKEKDVFRVVVLGDSFTEALQIPLEQTFPYIVEKKLNSESNKRFEVMNLGIGAFATAQEYLMLKHYGLKYQPDFVILAFFIGNDVRGNSVIIDSEHYYGKPEGIERNRPFFVLNNGKLEELPFKIKASNPSKDGEQTKSGVTGQFQILNFLAMVFPNIYYSLSDRIKETPWLANFLWKIGIKKSKPEPLLDKSKHNGIYIDDDYVYAEEYTPEWENAWEVTKSLILKLAKELEMNKIGFLVVIIPNEFEFRPDILDKVLKQDTQTMTLEFDIRKPERILSTLLESNNIDYLLLRPEVEKYSRETGKDDLHFHVAGDNHWNANGHVLAAQLIYKKLKEDNLVPIK